MACPQHTTRSLFVTGIPPALRRTSLPPTALLVRWRRGSEVRRLLREIARDLTTHGGEMFTEYKVVKMANMLLRYDLTKPQHICMFAGHKQGSK